MRHLRQIVVLGAVLALVALACGDASGDADEVPAAPSLPPADAGSPGPGAAGTCLEGEPDCQDIPGVPAEPIPLPEPGADPGDGGLVVGEAVTVSAAPGSTGVITVRGFVVEDQAGLRLCEALAESFPPQCGGASIDLADLSTVDPDDLTSSQGVTWSDLPVTIIGEVTDGVLVPQ